MFVGCHVSIAGGVENAPRLARKLGCETMQIFTRSPQGGKVPGLNEKTIAAFKANCEKNKIKNVYVHTPYFINLASANNKIYYGSIGAIKTELERASALSAKYVMTHLGSARELGEKEAIKKIISAFEKIFDDYKGKAKLLIENSAGAGKIIGADFKEIGKVLKEFTLMSDVETRRPTSGPALAGICLDIQHSFASGYGWESDQKGLSSGWKELGKYIGFKKVKLIHANDSAVEIGSRKDRHAHIGKGRVGLEAFTEVISFAKERDIDMICEMDYPDVMEDVKILKELRDKK